MHKRPSRLGAGMQPSWSGLIAMEDSEPQSVSKKERMKYSCVCGTSQGERPPASRQFGETAPRRSFRLPRSYGVRNISALALSFSLGSAKGGDGCGPRAGDHRGTGLD